MKHHFTQQLEYAVPDDVKPASNIQVVIATVVLALLLQVFWRCCCSFYRNQVKKFKFSSSSSSAVSAANLDPSTIAAVEEILNYTFKDKRLLEEALTHSSCRENMSYDRLEFVGDAALGLTVATHFFFLSEPKLNSHQLTQMRIESVSNERLARVAAKLGLYQFVRSKDTALNRIVRKYVEAVKQGDDLKNPTVCPKILSDVVESLAGAVYLDLNFDLTKLWRIFKDVLMVDEIMVPNEYYESSEIINGAQDELRGLCGKRRWGNPYYRPVKEECRQNEMKYVFSVEVETESRVLRQLGDEKSNRKDARNSAAYRLLHSPQLA